MHRDQRGDAYTLGKQLAHAMAGRLGGDHGDVHVVRGLDLLEMNVETVREHERLAFGHVRRNFNVV
jgi:hypothetical protein